MPLPPSFGCYVRIGTALLFPLAPLTTTAQEWRPLLRGIYSFDFKGVAIDAPEGIVVLSAPSPDAEVVRVEPGPLVINATNYVEVGEARYYLTPEANGLMWEEKPFTWIAVPGTGRAEFIDGTTPATLVKRETRDFFKTGPETAEVYEETVNLAPVTEWGPAWRRAEIDFHLPAKVVSLRDLDEGGWELVLTVYPAFESSTDRIPGPAPENYGEPHQALITRPVQREVRVRGPGASAKYAPALLPGTVWAAAVSEGRIAELRIGWHDIQPPYEVSRLSAPHVSRGETLRFRFLANRLLDTPGLIEVEPDLVVGVDYTAYDPIALLGGAPGPDSEPEFEDYLHRLWNVVIGPDLAVRVVAPLLDGRGAAGMLELESLGLGPSFEDELKALAEMAKAESPSLPAPESDDWLPIREHKLGSVPEAQRGPESEF